SCRWTGRHLPYHTRASRGGLACTRACCYRKAIYESVSGIVRAGSETPSARPARKFVPLSGSLLPGLALSTSCPPVPIFPNTRNRRRAVWRNAVLEDIHVESCARAVAPGGGRSPRRRDDRAVPGRCARPDGP